MSLRRATSPFPPCSHLACKRGVFHYRRKLPKTHGGELTLALRTVNYREAAYRVGLLDRLFNRVLRRQSNMVDLKAILRQQLAEALAADLDQHLSARPWHTVYLKGPHLDDDRTPVDADLDFIDGWLEDAQEQLVHRDTSLVAKDAAELSERYGIPIEQHRDLALGLLQIHIQMLEAGRQRLLRGAVVTLPPRNVPLAV